MVWNSSIGLWCWAGVSYRSSTVTGAAANAPAKWPTEILVSLIDFGLTCSAPGRSNVAAGCSAS